MVRDHESADRVLANITALYVILCLAAHRSLKILNQLLFRLLRSYLNRVCKRHRTRDLINTLRFRHELDKSE